MGNFFNKQNEEKYFYREQNIISDKKQKLFYKINVQIIRNLHNIQRFIKSEDFFITINLPYNYNNHPYKYKDRYKNIKSSYFPSSIKIIETNQLYALIDLPNSIKYFHLNYFCKKCINPSTQVKSYIKIPHKIIKVIIGCKKGERNSIVKLEVYNKHIKQIYFVNNNIETSEIINFL